MKKEFLLLSVVTLSIVSNCLSCDSLRMGLSVGLAQHLIKAKNIGTGDQDKLKKSSPSVGIFIGYDHLINETPLFLGLEVSANNHNWEKTRLLTSWPYPYQLRLKTNNSVGGSLRFGVKANNTLLYLKGGASSTNWQTKVIAEKNKDQDIQRNYQKMGYVAGFGFESRVSPNFSIGVDHEYSFSKELNNMHPDIRLSMKPNMQTTSFRLVYNF